MGLLRPDLPRAEGQRPRRRNGERLVAMLFIVIERFRDNDMLPICERLRAADVRFPTGSTMSTAIAANFHLVLSTALETTCGWSNGTLEWRGSARLSKSCRW